MSTTKQPPVNNPWFGATMVLAGIIGGYVIAVSTGKTTVVQPAAPAPSQPTAQAPRPAPTPPAAPSADNVVPVSDEDHVRGDRDATISVIEYSDFQCPFCARHHPTMAQLIDEVDDVNWVYRHYPLPSHSLADDAAHATECAGEQGKFWEYTDKLFEDGVNPATFAQIAEELGMDASDFETCMESDKYAQKIADQMSGGQAAGVTGTPGNIILNNKTGEARLVPGAQQLAAFSAVIEELR